MRCQLVYSVVIFSHRFLDSDCINFKTFAFLAVYWPFWTSLYSTDIKVQQQSFLTMLNNVFNLLWGDLSYYTLLLSFVQPFDRAYINNPGPIVVFATPGMLHSGCPYRSSSSGLHMRRTWWSCLATVWQGRWDTRCSADRRRLRWRTGKR